MTAENAIIVGIGILSTILISFIAVDIILFIRETKRRVQKENE